MWVSWNSCAGLFKSLASSRASPGSLCTHTACSVVVFREQVPSNTTPSQAVCVCGGASPLPDHPRGASSPFSLRSKKPLFATKDLKVLGGILPHPASWIPPSRWKGSFGAPSLLSETASCFEGCCKVGDPFVPQGSPPRTATLYVRSDSRSSSRRSLLCLLCSALDSCPLGTIRSFLPLSPSGPFVFGPSKAVHASEAGRGQQVGPCSFPETQINGRFAEETLWIWNN